MTKTKKEVVEILNILEKDYPDAECELDYSNSFQLLVATILSAQTTDKKVNEVTKKLFAKYKTPKDYLEADMEELQQDIKVIGLYRNKSKNIVNMCRTLVYEYDSKVPNTKEELMKLSGVGRKTANVVLSNAFKVPAIAVDTHVFRVSNRIGLAHSNDVLNTEKQLQELIPISRWSKAHHLLIFHGRRTCKSRKPNCEKCSIAPYCEYVY